MLAWSVPDLIDWITIQIVDEIMIEVGRYPRRPSLVEASFYITGTPSMS
jgi:hypothetical protein